MHSPHPTTPNPDAEHAPELPRPARRSVARPVAAVLAIVLAISLAAATLDLFPLDGDTLPTSAVELALDRHNLQASGVDNPVTAVLLNFRAFDTWLELGVLWLALLGILALQRASNLQHIPPAPAGGYVLTRLIALLVPIMILVAGYILWRGTRDPGGAFQAGALLAAAGVLLRIAGITNPATLPGPALRVLSLAGFATFALIAVLGHFITQTPFAYPRDAAAQLIFLVEVLATVSIAMTLVALFAGAYPSSTTHWPNPSVADHAG